MQEGETKMKIGLCTPTKNIEKVKEIVLMGGITEPLIFAKRQMDELNFSCDPVATYTVLTKGKNVSVITGNNCLKVLVTREDYDRELNDYNNPIVPYIKDKVDYWFDYNLEKFGINGTYNWDVTAATYLMKPEFFKDDICISRSKYKWIICLFYKL